MVYYFEDNIAGSETAVAAPGQEKWPIRETNWTFCCLPIGPQLRGQEQVCVFATLVSQKPTSSKGMA